MKKIIAILLVLPLLATVLSGCSQADTNKEGKTSIVCTIFPQYDWIRQILGNQADNFDLTLLLDDRIDLHSYQPSVDDIVKISSCDLFIYVGGESDEWVEDALAGATNENMIVISLLEEMGDQAKEEEIIEGMEEEEEEEGDEEGEEEAEYDEHVWLSLKNTALLCPAIADALSSLDSKNAEKYQSNLAAYLDKVAALDGEYQTAVSAAPIKTLLCGDRFPFRYLVDDYGISYFAAFPGCSAETEASFETIVFLAEKVDEYGLNTIIVTESADQTIAKTIRANTESKDQQILVMDALQSVAASDIAGGATYLAVMQSNLDVLKEALK
ncbi:MAG: metal ABC transporter substrate-binding protein [Lachnospiraceae bacterium]|jgi:zinc transport system substrate-binding protein|nr:metal ABC transporter substrate-binding protein [Lachnospiraceae bacterium]